MGKSFGRIITGIASLGISEIFREKPSKPQTPQAPQAPSMGDADAAALATAKRKRKSIARSKSTFTSPLGLKEEATTAKKMLLGQ